LLCKNYELFALLKCEHLDVNSITLVNLIMSIGLVVDYSAHIIHTWFKDAKDTGTETEEQLAKYSKDPTTRRMQRTLEVLTF